MEIWLSWNLYLYHLSLNAFWTRLLPNTYVNDLWNIRSHERQPDIYISETSVSFFTAERPASEAFLIKVDYLLRSVLLAGYLGKIPVFLPGCFLSFITDHKNRVNNSRNLNFSGLPSTEFQTSAVVTTEPSTIRSKEIVKRGLI